MGVELLAGAAGKGTFPLQKEADGYYSGFVPEAAPGTLYQFRLSGGLFPDPASRFQPQGPHGPSQVIDPSTFAWSDQAWRGLEVADLVIYEMHLGTFTPEGTWLAAMAELPNLKALGITCLEIMPLAEFSGRFGWGYDGVDLFAPTHLYGCPDDVRAFINRAHELGMAVIHDVVYSHLGPDGNYLGHFSKDYFTKKYECEWGEAINFDDRNSGPVREFFLTNVRYWIEEYHFDGYRFDATQQIFDAVTPHISAEMSRVAREAARGRRVLLVGENEPQESWLLGHPESGGGGLDCLWNDDFHHSAQVAASGRREAYYLDYTGKAQELLAANRFGFLFQGQYYQWQRKRRGTPALGIPHSRFVHYLQNHDQVANSLRGERLHALTSPSRYRALTALLLLGPSVPLLFQGQEFASSSPFLYFADHKPDLAKLVSKGRREFLAQFASIASPEAGPEWREPGNEESFQACKLRFAERETHAKVHQLHKDLLTLRREDKTIRSAPAVDGAVLSEQAFLLRYFAEGEGDRLLIINLGPDLCFGPSPEPLLAPMKGKGWTIVISTEHPAYGGSGAKVMETTDGWVIPAESATLMKPDENPEIPSGKCNQNS